MGGFVIGPTLSTSDQLARETSKTTQRTLAAPPGTRLVGFQGVAVAVPDDWGIDRIRAGRCQLPVEDTVVFPSRKLVLSESMPCGLAERTSSLHLIDVSTEDISLIVEDASPAGRVDGVPTFRTSLRPQLCDGERCSPHQFNQALIVPSRDVLLYVNSPQKSTIESVLGTIRLIPPGYTAVPDLSGLIADGDQLRRLVEAAGLTWDRVCPSGSVCDMGEIEATDPAAGSVVPEGTIVRSAVDSAQLPDLSPTEADLLGRWRPVVLLGNDVRTLRPLVAFERTQSGLGWSGYDGCNWGTGQVDLREGGVFSTSHNESTLRGCTAPGADEGTFVTFQVLERATRIRLQEGRLSFYNNDNTRLGTFIRATEAEPSNSPQEDDLKVPSVTGLLQSEAARLLEASGLAVEMSMDLQVAHSCGQNDCFPFEPGHVIAQQPLSGQDVRPGSTVTLFVYPSRPSEVTEDDRRVVGAFIRFANDPELGGPFDTPIGLGLGGELVKTITPEQSDDPEVWALDPFGYAERGHGRVSALDLVNENADNLRLTVGPEPVCANSENVTYESGLNGGGRIVRIQQGDYPRPDQSCMDWWSVDLSINPVGQVVGATVFLGSP
jgi:hypothetical protein